MVAGAGFGPVLPVVFAFAAGWFPASSGSASGVLAIAAAVGAIVVPWFQGRRLDQSGPVAVTLVGCLLLGVLALVVKPVSETRSCAGGVFGVVPTE